MNESTNMALLRQALQEPDGHRFVWPECETCGHRRIAHSPERGGGWRCRFRGKKRTGERCDCMRYRGELKITRVPTKGGNENV